MPLATDFYRGLDGHCFPLQPFKLGNQKSKAPATGVAWREARFNDSDLPTDSGVGWAISPDVVVLDVEAATPDGHAIDGRESFDRFCRDHGFRRHQVPCVESPNGGHHAYFKLPPGARLRSSQFQLKAYPGIDFRGHGAYVVAAGSPHWQGGNYTLNPLADLADMPPLECPSAMVALMQAKPEAERPRAAAATISVETLAELLSVIDVHDYRGTGMWFELAAACHSATGGAIGARDVFIEWSWGDPEYFGDDSVGKRWDSCKADKGLTVKTLLRHARDSAAGDLHALARISEIEHELPPEPETVASGEKRPGLVRPRCVVEASEAEEFSDPLPPVIEGVLRRGETANLIAAPKTGKSWLAYSLALSVATGRKWLDTYDVHTGRVLLIDNELHENTLYRRIPKVAERLGIDKEDYRGRFDAHSLRGNLVDYNKLSRLIEQIKAGDYDLIIVDAHYRMLPPGVNENDNAAMAQVYNTIDQYAGHTDAAFVLIHHTTKGDQSGKSITDVGAGAGSQSRAADAHLVLRSHQEEGHVVLDAAVRSWAPAESVTLKWDWPVWVPTDLDPTQLETTQGKKQGDRNTSGKRTLLELIRETGPASLSQLKPRSEMGYDRLKRLLDALEESGEVDVSNGVRFGNQCALYTVHL